MEPRFSVLIPAYNNRALIRETVDSALSQDYPGSEVVVVDDGSTDGTWEVLQSYGKRIRSFRQANKGAEVARNTAAALARGEYLVLLDHDDLLLPGALATYDRVIAACGEPPLVVGSLRIHGTADSATRGDGAILVYEFSDFLARLVPLGRSCSQLVIKKTVAEAAGSLRTVQTAFPYDTADILLSLGTFGPCVAVHSPATVAYRLHASNTIANLDFMLRRMPRLLGLERKGMYPGGSDRRFARRAYLGSLAWYWSMQSLRHGPYGLPRVVRVLGLLIRSFPMIAAGVAGKLQKRFFIPVPRTRTISA